MDNNINNNPDYENNPLLDIDVDDDLLVLENDENQEEDLEKTITIPINVEKTQEIEVVENE